MSSASAREYFWPHSISIPVTGRMGQRKILAPARIRCTKPQKPQVFTRMVFVYNYNLRHSVFQSSVFQSRSELTRIPIHHCTHCLNIGPSLPLSNHGTRVIPRPENDLSKLYERAYKTMPEISLAVPHSVGRASVPVDNANHGSSSFGVRSSISKIGAKCCRLLKDVAESIRDWIWSR